MFDMLIDQHELRQRRHIEARSLLVQRPDNRRFSIGLDCEIRLHLWQVLLEFRVILPNQVMVDHNDRSAMLAGDRLKLLGGHVGSNRAWPLCGFQFPHKRKARLKARNGKEADWGQKKRPGSPLRGTSKLLKLPCAQPHSSRLFADGLTIVLPTRRRWGVAHNDVVIHSGHAWR